VPQTQASREVWGPHAPPPPPPHNKKQKTGYHISSLFV